MVTLSPHRSRLALRILAAAVSLALVAGSPLGAQTPGPEIWEGTWRGPFVSDGPSGIFTLVIARDGGEWKVLNQIESEGLMLPAGDVREWKVEGGSFTFVQAIAEFDVVFRGTMEGASIKGTVEGYQAGVLAGTGSFTLTRQ